MTAEFQGPHSYIWEALVVYQDETLDGSPLVWKWFSVEQLRPLYPDPNPRDAEFYEGRSG